MRRSCVSPWQDATTSVLLFSLVNHPPPSLPPLPPNLAKLAQQTALRCAAEPISAVAEPLSPQAINWQACTAVAAKLPICIQGVVGSRQPAVRASEGSPWAEAIRVWLLDPPPAWSTECFLPSAASDSEPQWVLGTWPLLILHGCSWSRALEAAALSFLSRGTCSSTLATWLSAGDAAGRTAPPHDAVLALVKSSFAMILSFLSRSPGPASEVSLLWRCLDIVASLDCMRYDALSLSAFCHFSVDSPHSDAWHRLSIPASSERDDHDPLARSTLHFWMAQSALSPTTVAPSASAAPVPSPTLPNLEMASGYSLEMIQHAVHAMKQGSAIALPPLLSALRGLRLAVSATTEAQAASAILDVSQLLHTLSCLRDLPDHSAFNCRGGLPDHFSPQSLPGGGPQAGRILPATPDPLAVAPLPHLADSLSAVRGAQDDMKGEAVHAALDLCLDILVQCLAAHPQSEEVAEALPMAPVALMVYGCMCEGLPANILHRFCVYLVRASEHVALNRKRVPTPQCHYRPLRHVVEPKDHFTWGASDCTLKCSSKSYTDFPQAAHVVAVSALRRCLQEFPVPFGNPMKGMVTALLAVARAGWHCTGDSTLYIHTLRELFRAAFRCSTWGMQGRIIGEGVIVTSTGPVVSISGPSLSGRVNVFTSLEPPRKPLFAVPLCMGKAMTNMQLSSAENATKAMASISVMEYRYALFHTASHEPESLPFLLHASMMDCIHACHDYGRVTDGLEVLCHPDTDADVLAALATATPATLEKAFSSPPPTWLLDEVSTKHDGSPPYPLSRTELLLLTGHDARGRARIAHPALAVPSTASAASPAAGSITDSDSGAEQTPKWPSWARAIPKAHRELLYSLASVLAETLIAFMGDQRCVRADLRALLTAQWVWTMHRMLAGDGIDISKGRTRPRLVTQRSTPALKLALMLDELLRLPTLADRNPQNALGVDAALLCLQRLIPLPKRPSIAKKGLGESSGAQKRRRPRGSAAQSPSAAGSRGVRPRAARSRNRVIDAWLAEEGAGEGGDTYADLEDFIADE